MEATQAALPPAPSTTLDEKLAHLNRMLRSMGKALVAYSGGVDSALLALAAHRVLGENAMAVTADSASYATGELAAAQEITEKFGIHHQVLQTEELDNPDYASNPANRCYFCKKELFTKMQQLARQLEFPFILYGQNVDDVGDFRPGALAADEFGVRAPLREANFDKQEVRELARRWGLPVWDRPAMACLSSRFPYGTPVTREGLSMVDRAEAFLRQAGFVGHRVRHHAPVARIELPKNEISRLLCDSELARRTVSNFADLGYSTTALDLRGFRSGSLNEALKGQQGGLHPNPVHQQELPSRAGSALAEMGFTGAAIELYDQMICVGLPSKLRLQLANLELRQSLVEKLGELGFRYVALDLSHSDH